RCRTGTRRFSQIQSHVWLHSGPPRGSGIRIIEDSLSHNDVWNSSSQSVAKIVANAPSDVIVIGDSRLQIDPAHGMYERMSQIARETGAGMVYSDSSGNPR